MSSIASREQFEQLLAQAEQLAAGMARASAGAQQQVLLVLAQHLTYARATVAHGRCPSDEEKAALQLGRAATWLTSGREGEELDPATAWLHAALSLLEDYYRGLRPPVPPCAPSFALGAHVVVPWSSGARVLGFVRHPQEQSYLVAFANGHQQWFDARQLTPGPEPGERLAAAGPAGQWLTGTLVAIAQGQYLVALEDGRREWFDWTVIRPV